VSGTLLRAWPQVVPLDRWKGFMTRFMSLPLALAAAVSLSLTACGSNDDDGPVASTASASTPKPTPKTPTATKAAGRTAAELTRALLVLTDLPSGFSQEKDDPADDEAKPFSSSSSRCEKLVDYLNANQAPDAKASVQRSFSGGPEGPFVDFGLDAMGSADAVAKLRASFKKAVNACAKVTLKIEDQGSSPMQVEQIDAPQFGTKPYAFRLTGTSGPLRGREVTMAIAGVEDVIVSVSLMAGQEGELEGATEAAVSKAQQVLKKGA
jgi:hypothetical protein